MGLTWIFTVFAIIPGTMQYPFTYIFCILNTLQGFFIFVVYVLLSKIKYATKKFQKKISANFKMNKSETESQKEVTEDDIKNFENLNSLHDAQDAKTL